MGLSLLASHLPCLATKPDHPTGPGYGSLPDRHYGTFRQSHLRSRVDLARSGRRGHEGTVDADVYLVLEPLARSIQQHFLGRFVAGVRRGMIAADLAFADLALDRYMVPAH